MAKKITKPVEILMVDDEPLDVELFQRSLMKAKVANTLHHSADGEQALQFMRQHMDQPTSGPLLVLMDINMPRMTGIECIRRCGRIRS